MRRRISLGGFAVAVSLLALGAAAMATEMEVTKYYVTANSNNNYDRNPSFAVYGGEYWLFYTKGDYDSTQGIRMSVYNPDNDYYTIWYKRSSTPFDIMTVAETRLDLSFSNRPVGFDQRDVSAVVFGGNLYVFASAGFGGSQQPIYYYKWDGSSWSGPTMLYTNGGGHANAVVDADRVYITMEKGVPDTMRAVIYTWDGTNFNGPYTVASDNGVPKIATKDGTLYVVSIAPSATAINLHTSPATATPTTWTYLADPITVTDAYVWDPSLCVSGSTIFAFAAPSTSVPDRQWIVQTTSTDNGATWAPIRTVSSGGHDSVYWWDYWPIGVPDGEGSALILFTTEGYDGYYLDGMIGAIGIDWDLNNDHTFYIQSGIDAAADSDTVLVGEGTWTGNGNRDLDFRGKSILLRSSKGRDTTIIDCEGDSTQAHQAIFFRNGEDSTTIVDGFTLRGAYCNTGAVRCSTASATIRNCLITANNCSGVYVSSGSRLSLAGCTISDNNGDGAHAMTVGRPFNLVNCSVKGNAGDGINSEWSTGVTVVGSEIAANNGCGVNLHTVSSSEVALVSNTLIRGNGSDGFYFYTMTPTGSFIIQNCTVVSNRDGIAFAFDMPKDSPSPSRPRYLDTSFINNTITAFNRESGIHKTWVLDFAYILTCNDSYGNSGGDYVNVPFGAGDTLGNISRNPLFCDTTSFDYRIFDLSPCAPANNSCYKLLGRYDIGCYLDFCGDANGDAGIDISDAVYLIAYIFGGGPAPAPYLAGDANCDGAVDISDAVYLVAYIFAGGPAPCAEC